MRQYRFILLLGVGVLILQGISYKHKISQSTPRIAIVGGGIGGASASHFLTEIFNGDLLIDLYEAKTIGGRLATIEVDGHEVEAGGSIIHPRNMYMQRFVKLLDLEKNLPSDEKMGIWNGDEFIFIKSDWSMISMMKLFYRYGFQPYQLKRHIDSMIEDFAKIYDLQDAGRSFTNVNELLSAMNKDFPKLLNMSTKKYLLDLGYSEKLIDELVQAASVVNYGQEVSIQSFVGSISLAAGDDLWSVKGGNKKVPQLLIRRNEKVKVVPSRVTKIRNLPSYNNSRNYEVTYINEDNTTMTSTYDIVIIAAPLTKDQEFQIEFVDFPNDLVFPGKYQTTYATFVKADLNLKYFGLQKDLDSILSCNPNKTKISSVGKLDSVDGLNKTNLSVWKIFSRKPLETCLLYIMFSHVTENKEIAWKAYPHYSTNMNLGNFKLHNALYHVNAIEWAASAMEMSAIAGRNVATMAYKDFSAKFIYDNEVPKGKDSTKKLRRFAEL